MPDYETFLDAVKKTHDGDSLQMNKEFIAETTFLKDAPYKEANEKDRDVGVFYSQVDPFTTVDFTNLDNGVKPTKTGSYQRAEVMGMVESAIEFNKKTIEHMDGAEKQIAVQDAIRQRRIQIGLDTEFALINCEPNTNPDAPLGLLPRFNVITNEYGEILDQSGVTGEKTPYVTLDAEGGLGTDSGADGKLSSLILVYFNPTDGVCQIYPRGWKPGIKEEYSEWYTEKNTRGELVKKSNVMMQNKFGLKIGNALACTRIANINPKNDTSMEKMIDLVYDAVDRMPKYMQTSVRIYTTNQVCSALRKKNRSDRTAVAVLEENDKYNLAGEIRLDNFVVTACSSMLRTEGRIKLIGEV